MNVKVRVLEKYKVIQCQGHINSKVQGDTNVKVRVMEKYSDTMSRSYQL